MNEGAARPRGRGVRHFRTPAGSAFIALAFSALFLPASAAAHSYTLGDIAVGHLWSPPFTASAEGLAVYGPIAVLNKEAPAHQIVGVNSTISGKVRFRSARDGAEQWPPALVLAPGRPLSLAPWGVHIWLSDLNRVPSAGDSFDLTLDFGKSGTLTVKVVVETATGH
ncbi:copper chaperone PCu(A)C [Thalassobaculum sp.]|uniref:copper chaperone PCu(A)C n=1 Tax=Thalassobaculum sp. TaxID=2022740 RepID=UPI0032EFC5D0